MAKLSYVCLYCPSCCHNWPSFVWEWKWVRFVWLNLDTVPVCSVILKSQLFLLYLKCVRTKKLNVLRYVSILDVCLLIRYFVLRVLEIPQMKASLIQGYVERFIKSWIVLAERFILEMTQDLKVVERLSNLQLPNYIISAKLKNLTITWLYSVFNLHWLGIRLLTRVSRFTYLCAPCTCLIFLKFIYWKTRDSVHPLIVYY